MYSFGGGHGMGTVVREGRIRARPTESAIAIDRGGRLSGLVQPRRLRRLRQSVCGLRLGNAGIRGRFLSSTSTNNTNIKRMLAALFVFSVRPTKRIYVESFISMFLIVISE